MNSGARESIRARRSLRVGIFGAEPWGEGMRNEIESAFGLDACDIYGLSEVMGPGVAQEFAGTKEGPTIWEDHFLPEIVDPQSGEAVAEGEAGELVFTSLTKEANARHPLSDSRSAHACCPATSPRCAVSRRITGRSDDMLIIRGVNVFPSQIEELILHCRGLAPHYEIEITRPHRLDEVRVTVEARPELASHEHPAEARLLAHKLKSIIGISADIQVVVAGSVPRSTGKAARVTDRRR